jgi:hypothetical protein
MVVLLLRGSVKAAGGKGSSSRAMQLQVSVGFANAHPRGRNASSWPFAFRIAEFQVADIQLAGLRLDLKNSGVPGPYQA